MSLGLLLGALGVGSSLFAGNEAKKQAEKAQGLNENLLQEIRDVLAGALGSAFGTSSAGSNAFGVTAEEVAGADAKLRSAFEGMLGGDGELKDLVLRGKAQRLLDEAGGDMDVALSSFSQSAEGKSVLQGLGLDPDIFHDASFREFSNPTDTQGHFDRSLEALLGARDTFNEGFDRARGEVSGIFDSDRLRAKETAVGARGDAQASLQSRGLANSTILDNANLGITANLERSLTDIDSRMAGIMSDLELGRTQALAGVDMAAANHFAGLADFEMGAANSLASALSGTTYVPSGGGTDLSGLGMLLPLLGGLGGGGGSDEGGLA